MWVTLNDASNVLHVHAEHIINAYIRATNTLQEIEDQFHAN